MQLGPILFALYVADMSKDLHESSLGVKLHRFTKRFFVLCRWEQRVFDGGLPCLRRIKKIAQMLLLPLVLALFYTPFMVGG